MTAGAPDPIRRTTGVASVPAGRIRSLNDAPVRPERGHVLYWMTANRRLGWNFALQRAVEQARALARPLLVFEPLRVDYPWAADRFHRFILDGMADNHRRLRGSGVGYYPWVERSRGAGSNLLASLAANAATVVTDDTPMFFYPAMLRAAAERLDVALEGVDSAGLLPVAATDKAFPTAYAFRRWLQRALPEHLDALPQAEPLAHANLPPFDADLGRLAPGFEPTEATALDAPATLAELPIDHAVPPVEETGGTTVARACLRRFVDRSLERYGEGRNHPDARHGSRLSAWLHFGHISVHEIFATIAAEEAWSPAHLSEAGDGRRQGWWGMSTGAESWLDQLVTWRELGLNMCHHRRDYDAFESLPHWALETLDAHRDDERTHLYELDELENAATHDELWNAAQTELVREGRIHNYLRMLWGKKILAWSRTPEAALHAMIELNNKYALDGRDPNSYSGIFWVLGRYDRPWGPERPVFGKVRYMTSSSARRKLRLREYLDAYGAQRPLLQEAGS